MLIWDCDAGTLVTFATNMKKHVLSNKALIVIPYWAADRSAAIALSILLADVQPQHSEDFDLLFVARFDCPTVDSATIKHVSRKFNTMTHTSRRREKGWPAGCNGTFFGALEFIYHKMNAGQIPGYKFIFFCESDTVPLSRDCFGFLLRTWDALAGKQTLCMAGALVPDGGREHINGGAVMITGNLGFLKWIAQSVGGMRHIVGWDWALAGDFRARGWANVPGIRSLWHTPTMPISQSEGWERQGVVWLHGVKDDSLRKFSRQILV